MPAHLARALLLLLAALACAATSPARSYRTYPAWRVVADPTRRVGCAGLGVRVAKSGKEGLGIVIDADATAATTDAAACRVEVRAARLTVGVEVVPGVPPAALDVPPGGRAHAYVPFSFDNEAAWNDGRVEGRLELDLVVDGAPTTWSLALGHVRDGVHSRRSAP